MKLQQKILMGLVGCSLISSGAYAQQSGTNKAELSGFFIGAEGSYNWVNSIDAAPGYQVTSERKKAAGYRVFTGYNLNENIAFELGYFGTANFQQSAVISGVAFYNASLKIRGGELSAMYKFTQGIPGLFIKAGATYSKVSGSINGTPPPGIIYTTNDQNGTGYLFGLGYEANLYPGLDGRLAYTRYERLGGDSDNKMNTVSLGLKYSF